MSSFKGWLKELPNNPYSCRCEVCGVELTCGKSELLRHASSAKHVKKLGQGQTRSISSFFGKTAEQLRLDENVSHAEIKISNFFAHHNVAFQTVDHLIPLLKDCFKDSKICQNLTLGRLKTTNIIKNVISQKETMDLSSQLRLTNFSVLVDETTDISANKLLCIVVRFINQEGELCDRLLEVVTIDAKECTAEKVFQSFKNCLESKNIPLSKIIGFAADNASIMVGKHNSFMTRLQGETKALVVLPCICHSAALVASNACSKLPRTPEEFVKSIATYFSISPKRSAQLAEMQEFFKCEQLKMLKLSGTRWLSMQHAVKRVLDMWDVLYHYFQVAKLEENSIQVNYIFDELNNSCTKAILLFLKYILNIFNTFNALFQSKKILVHELSRECKKIFYQNTSLFLLPQYLKYDIDCRNPRHFKNLDDLDLGSECNSFLKSLPKEVQLPIKKSCLEFLITASEDMQKRFPLNSDLFNNLHFLNPNIAMDLDKPEHLKTLKPVWEKFVYLDEIDGEQIEIEWKNIAIYFMNDIYQKELFLKKTITDFWFSLGQIKNFEDKFEFEKIYKLVRICLSLPHSNAETERVFSVVTDVKTKKRNKVGSEALNAVCISRFAHSNCCLSFNVEKSHLELMKTKNLYK